MLPGKDATADPAGADLGYRSVELASGVHRVTYRGDVMTPPELAEDYALLRAAEISLEAGFPHFRVRERADATSTATHTTTLPSVPICDAYGACYETPPTTITTTSTTPVFSFTIELVRQKTEDDSFVFDARFVLYALQEQHGVRLRVPADAWWADYACYDQRSPE